MFEIKALKCDSQKNNRVFGTAAPFFDWQTVSDAKNVMQSAYEIKLCSGKTVFWNTGKVKSDKSIGIKYEGAPLVPNTEYTFKLTVYNDLGEKAVCEENFVSGKLDEKWKGKWISCGFPGHPEEKIPPTVFKKKFKVGAGLRRAALYSTALGVYRAFCNGELVSEDLDAPGLTSYHKRVYYQLYDVTDMLHEGENEFRSIVSNGWYCGRIVNVINNWGNRTSFKAEIHLFYEDGSETVIPTDLSWRWTGDGPMRFSEYYDGEIYDATRCDEELWKWHDPIVLPKYEVPKTIIYQESPRIRRREKLVPTPVENDKGEVIWDFGQNFAGCICMEINAPRGTVITVKHGEELEIGNYLYTRNLTNCLQQITYTCAGEKNEFYEPSFTSMGFRYIQISGVERSAVKVWAYARYSDIERIGNFECSDERINKFQSMIRWTQQSNFQDVPSDCPQRYERMGWTGDFATFIRTAVMNLDTQSFARKWLGDLKLDQMPSGSVPWNTPVSIFYGLSHENSPCGWADAAVIVPWAIYLAYGDVEVLRAQYESMKKLVDYETRLAAWDSKGWERFIWDSGYHFGDWLMPYTWYTDWYKTKQWLPTTYFANSANLLSRAAKVLGYDDDAEKYAKLYKNICDAFNKKFVKEDGTIDTPWQGVLVCAIAFGLLNEETKKTVSRQLSEDIAKRDGCLASGVLSVAYIMDALSSTGRMQEALDLLFNEKMPSWLYMVKEGATTIWESWNGKSDYTTPIPENSIGDIPSHNHYWIGAVGKWIYENIAGLRLREDKPGYKAFRVAPVMTKRLTSAKMELESPYGKISVSWRRNRNDFRISVTVPVNTEAEIVMPGGKTHNVGSGKYEFTSKLSDDVIYE